MKKIPQREAEISDQIIAFLKSHELISKNGLEKKVGIKSQGTLVRCVNEGKQIPFKYLFGLLYELGKYGMELDGYRILPDNNTPHIFLIKDVGPPEVVEEEPGVFVYKQKQHRDLACAVYDLF